MSTPFEYTYVISFLDHMGFGTLDLHFSRVSVLILSRSYYQAKTGTNFPGIVFGFV